jgi:endonuclease/exonuclease/phosphatase family metal-dependent hydrolase
MKIKILSANVQAGARTQKYRHYVTRAWHHVLPFGKQDQATRWAEGLAEYEWVALQEADSGSMRSAFQNQSHQLADAAGFNSCHHQINRTIGKVLTSGNALLARNHPFSVRHLPLPGGRRGVLVACYQLTNGEELLVVVTHLSLRAPSRLLQANFLAELLSSASHVILLGDFNAPPDRPEFAQLRERLVSVFSEATYPSWAPVRCLDHVWVRGVEVVSTRAIKWDDSDHLAVEVSLNIPGAKLVSQKIM